MGAERSSLLFSMMLLLVVVDVVVVGVGRVAGCHIVKATNYKRWGWDQSSDVRMLFEGDPARPSHTLHVETSNKQGKCVLKIRCRNYSSLISYHSSPWIYAATHIRSHNITTAQDIGATDALASESEVSAILQAAWASVPNSSFPHLLPCSYILFFSNLVYFGIGLKRLSPM